VPKETKTMGLEAVPPRSGPQRSLGINRPPTTSTIPDVVPLIVGLVLFATGCGDRGPTGARPAIPSAVTATVETDPVPHAGDRRDNSIAIYRLDEASRHLVEVAARKLHPGVATYGSCMYRSRRTGGHYLIVTSKTGTVEQWELFERAGGVDGRRVREFRLGSQTEGGVADDELGSRSRSGRAARWTASSTPTASMSPRPAWGQRSPAACSWRRTVEIRAGTRTSSSSHGRRYLELSPAGSDPRR
jgi:hypothetical protein